MNILAIDPGPIESAYVVLNNNLEPVDFGKVGNEELLNKIGNGSFSDCENVAIEMVACYGMAVGKEIFDTCVWIGRFIDRIIYELDKKPNYIYRKDEKITICQSMKANDSNIRRALIDRFAKHDFKNGKGTKKKPDWFYGFKADIWAAYAVGVTFYDSQQVHAS